MAPELEKPRVTEIHVRMDCNGCVQKIKKALHGINDPERIVKAIKKTRKIATICSHEEQTEPAPPPAEQAPEGGAPAPEASNPPTVDQAPPPAETAPLPEAAPPKQSLPTEHPTPEEAAPTPVATEANPNEQIHHQRSRDVGEVHTTYHHPPEYGYRYGYSQGYTGYWNRYHNSQGHPQEANPTPTSMGPTPIPPPVYVTHSYNTYRRTPYVTEYEHIQPPPQHTHFSRMNHYNEDHHINVNNGNGNITSIFSDENPNACTVM